MTRMTTGTAVVETLLQHGVDTVFGLPGVQIYEYFNALQRAGDRVSVYTTRHEQAAGLHGVWLRTIDRPCRNLHGGTRTGCVEYYRGAVYRLWN